MSNMTGTTYRPNGAQEVNRRIMQIAAGRLKAENGLIPAPVIVIPEVSQNLVVEAPVKAKRKAAPRKAKVAA